MAHNASSAAPAVASDDDSSPPPSGGPPQNRKPSLTADEAIKMLGEHVQHVRVYEQEPTPGSPARTYGLRHCAVVARTDAGNEYLVHNGPGCGHAEGDAVILPLKSIPKSERWQPVPQHADDNTKDESTFPADWVQARDGVTMSRLKDAAASRHFNKMTYNCSQVVRNVLDFALPRKPL